MDALATVLGKTEHEVQEAVGKLEELCGYPSEDVRLLADAQHQLRTKIAQLGLDPDDTTGPELYHALLAKYSSDCAAIDRSLNINDQTSVSQKLAKVKDLLNHTMQLHGVWVLKPTVAKKLLLANPPKKLMKQLNYRSAASLVKHQNPAELILAAEQLESTTWNKTFKTKVAHLSSTDFELRLPQTFNLSPKLASSSLAGQVIVSQLAGAVTIWPGGADLPSLTMALLLMDGLEQLGEQQAPQNLASAHIALRWWSGAEHLVFNADGQPISLNFKDVAANQLSGASYGDHLNQNGYQVLWSNLMNRYKNYVDELPGELLPAQTSSVLKPELALEPIEIYE